MMIVLFDTYFTDFAMVASPRFFLYALEAYFFGLVNVQGNILFLFDFGWKEQRYIEEYHSSYNYSFNCIEIVLLVDEQTMKNKQTAEGCE